jgi:Xaa-Pro aminopeptidase
MKHEPAQPFPQSSRREFLTRGAGIAAAAGLIACSSLPDDQDMSEETIPTGAADDQRSALDEQLAELTDQRHSVAPISPEEHAARRVKLGALLAERNLDAMVVEPGATMTYLAGVSWGLSERLFALTVLADGSHFWLCPAFEEERARELTGAGEVHGWQEHEYAYAPLASALGERRARHLCVDPNLRYVHVDGLARAMRADPARAAHDVLLELRGRKDEHELALMRRANELTQQAICAASQLVRPGMTGDELGAIVKHAHTRLGLRGHWDLSLFGPAAAKPHGKDRSRPLERGDMILVDTGGSLHGYQSDNTRSWVFDAAPTKRQLTVWNAVRDAQRRAFEAIAPGVAAKRVDAAARESLDASGLNQGYSAFTHRLGHGIGLEGHEAPYFDGGSEVILAAGMTFSDEPGLYYPGEFGVRIEDIIAVTEEGATHFGDWQAAPGSPASV